MISGVNACSVVGRCFISACVFFHDVAIKLDNFQELYSVIGVSDAECFPICCHSFNSSVTSALMKCTAGSG